MNVMTDTETRAVTVCRGTRRVDVRLPAAVPVAELMPGLLDLAEGDRPGDGPAVVGSPRTWGLVPVGRPPLDWGHSLADAGVANGDVLILTEETTAATGAAIYDVADLAATRIELTGPTFGLGHALVAWPGFAALAGAAAAVLPLVGVDVHPWAFTAVAVLLLATAVVYELRPYSTTLAGRLCAHAVPAAAIGCAAAATAGWLDGRSVAVAAGVAGVVTAALGLAVWLASEQRLVGAFAVPAGLAVSVAAGLDAATLSVSQIALAVGGLAFVAIGVAPRLAVTAGGMGDLDLLVRSGGSTNDGAVSTTVNRSNQILTGLLAGLAVTTAAAATVLGAGSTAAIVTAVILAAALLVRAQSFTRPVHRVVVRLPAFVAAALIPVAAGADLEIVVVAAVAFPLYVFGALLARWPGDVVARLRLVVGWLEVALVVALVPAIAAAAGLFDWLSGALS